MCILFCCYIYRFPLLHHLTKSRLCVVFLETPETAQAHVTFLALCEDVSPLPA
jgi:hypothetical protein